jgi:hypothetical protein
MSRYCHHSDSVRDKNPANFLEDAKIVFNMFQNIEGRNGTDGLSLKRENGSVGTHEVVMGSPTGKSKGLDGIIHTINGAAFLEIFKEAASSASKIKNRFGICRDRQPFVKQLEDQVPSSSVPPVGIFELAEFIVFLGFHGLS